MSSRQRLLAAIAGRQPDHLPCCFMLFNGLKAQCADTFEFVQRQLELGLDAYVQIPPRPPIVVNDYYNLHGLPVNYDPAVMVREWKESTPAGEDALLVKEYHTPAGILRAEVRQDAEWRWGDHVPFLDDYLVGRSQKFIIDGPADLPALRYLLTPPTAAEIQNFQTESAELIDFARQRDLLLTGGWGVGADLIGWVYGLQRLIYAVFDQPDFVADLLDIIAVWNRCRMEVLLKAGIDLFIKRAWYENCDYFTPRHYRQLIKPILKADVDLAHQYGAKFAYIITANCMPLLEDIREAGVDVIMGVDPMEWNVAKARRRLDGQVCLWGGVNGHLTVERGSADEVRQEVRKVMDQCGRQGGFILSPVDNVREYTPKAQANVLAMIDEWKKVRGD